MATFFDRSRGMNRLWGIPLLGIWVRAILVIPHVIVLWLYGIAIALLYLVMWIPVLVSGRYPSWGYSFVGGYLRWYLRVQAYVILVAATYPPFSGAAPHDVNVIWDEQQTVPRWAGIPLIGVMIRGILLIPHFIVIWLIGIAVAFVSLFTWIPVLLFGRYPDWGYTIVGGFMAYQMRLTSYMLLLTGPYPRFGFED